MLFRSGQRFEDFSVEDALENLTFRKRRRLIRLFIPNKIKGRADAVLLTQNFAWLGLMSINEQKQLYENIRDSVLSGMRLFVKVHPDDTLDYSGIFPKARIIERAFPSELLPYVFFHKPPLLYAVNSAGCENLIKHFKIRKLGRDVYAE